MASDGSHVQPADLDASRASIAVTAFWISAMRADETARGADALIQDPLAEALTGPGGRRVHAMFKRHFSGPAFSAAVGVQGVVAALAAVGAGAARGSPITSIQAASNFAWRLLRGGGELSRVHQDHIRRTAYIDRVCERAVAQGVRQVVTVGAGLDTRPFRLFADAPDVTAFEVDHPDLFAYKEAVLARERACPACTRRVVPVEYDRVAEWPALAAQAGFRPSKPTVFVLEGLLYYLDPAAQRGLLRAVASAAAPGSVCVGDGFSFAQARTVMRVGADEFVLHTTNAEWLHKSLLDAGFGHVDLAECRSDRVACALGAAVPLLPFLPRALWPYQRFLFTGTAPAAAGDSPGT